MKIILIMSLILSGCAATISGNKTRKVEQQVHIVYFEFEQLCKWNNGIKTVKNIPSNKEKVVIVRVECNEENQ